MKTEALTVRVTADLKRQILDACDLTDQNLAHFIERAIKQRLARLCPRCGSEAGVLCPCGAVRPHRVAAPSSAPPRAATNGTLRKTSAG